MLNINPKKYPQQLQNAYLIESFKKFVLIQKMFTAEEILQKK